MVLWCRLHSPVLVSTLASHSSACSRHVSGSAELYCPRGPVRGWASCDTSPWLLGSPCVASPKTLSPGWVGLRTPSSTIIICRRRCRWLHCNHQLSFVVVYSRCCLLQPLPLLSPPPPLSSPMPLHRQSPPPVPLRHRQPLPAPFLHLPPLHPPTSSP